MLLLFVAVGVYGSGLGAGSDRDSVRVIEAAQAILAGGYRRSRSFGFPLHEAACAVLFRIGGLRACNLGSVAVIAAGIWLARGLVAAERRWLVVCVLCACPLLLADASSAIDFGWDFTGGVGLCLVAVRGLRGRFSPAAYFAVAWALLLLRPDNVVFLAGVTAALVVSGVERRGAVLAAAGLAVVAAGLVYWWLNGAGVLATGVTTTRPWLARVARAAVFGSAALGPGGVLGLAAVFVVRAADAHAAFLRRVVLFCWALYLPRFVALPDQLDYLVLPVVFTCIAVAALPRLRLAAMVCALVCLPSFVTVSVFRRDDGTGALRFDLRPQWGALAQDWSARRFALRMETPAMTGLVQSKVKAGVLRYDVFMPGYLSDGRDLVIGRVHLYRVVAGRASLSALATVPRRSYRAIWACDVPLGPGVGWRGWEAPVGVVVGEFSCWRVKEG